MWVMLSPRRAAARFFNPRLREAGSSSHSADHRIEGERRRAQAVAASMMKSYFRLWAILGMRGFVNGLRKAEMTCSSGSCVPAVMPDRNVIALPRLDRQGNADQVGGHLIGGGGFGIEGDHRGGHEIVHQRFQPGRGIDDSDLYTRIRRRRLDLAGGLFRRAGAGASPNRLNCCVPPMLSSGAASPVSFLTLSSSDLNSNSCKRACTWAGSAMPGTALSRSSVIADRCGWLPVYSSGRRILFRSRAWCASAAPPLPGGHRYYPGCRIWPAGFRWSFRPHLATPGILSDLSPTMAL